MSRQGWKTSVPPFSTMGRGAGRETCGVYRCLQQCRILAHLGKSFHKGFVAGGLLHVVVELHPHQQTCTDAQRRFEQHGRVRGERTVARRDGAVAARRNAPRTRQRGGLLLSLPRQVRTVETWNVVRRTSWKRWRSCTR